MENYASALSVAAAAAAVPTPVPSLPNLNMLAGRDLNDCLDAGDIITSCVSAMPTFDSATNKEIAECFCCRGSSWDAGYFDKPVSSCYDFLTEEAPASTSWISVYSVLDGFCGSVGSVNCGGSATATPTATATGGSAGCTTAGNMINSCSTSIPDFDDASTDKIAACLCYDNGGNWDPDAFDGNMSSCLNWASTAKPTLYSSVSRLSTFCDNIGPVTVNSNSRPTTTATTTRNGDGGGNGFGGFDSATSTGQVIANPTESPAINDGRERVVARGGVAGLVTWVLGFYVML